MEHLLPQPNVARRVKTVKGPKTVTASRVNTVKYLSVCHDPAAYKSVLKAAPDAVVKTICNAALNVQRGGRVTLNEQQKKLFGKHRRSIDALASKKVPLSKKRKVLSQRGGAFWIPAMIGAALGALGINLFGGNKQ